MADGPGRGLTGPSPDASREGSERSNESAQRPEVPTRSTRVGPHECVGKITPKDCWKRPSRVLDSRRGRTRVRPIRTATAVVPAPHLDQEGDAIVRRYLLVALGAAILSVQMAAGPARSA